MSLGGLVLLDIINENFQATVDAAVIKVVTKAANLERLTATLMLTCVDACIQSFNQLIVAFE